MEIEYLDSRYKHPDFPYGYYQDILSDVIKNLKYYIDESIACGWCLQGGTSITKDGNDFIAIQMMVKEC